MTELAVVDASIALKWVLNEVDSGAAESLIERYRMAAPDLLVMECANAFWARIRRRTLSPAEARAALSDLLAIDIDYQADHGLTAAALSLAADLDHPVYDCMYLALALERGARVITADRRFAAAVRAHPFHADRIRLLSDLAP
ncbi:MAG TPA: type II toxin-antitoxin system VapC family toxin [Geminicoccaceae bacterium]|mgnify:CR=1 FL=1|nr:type II toxin-antitoxin system VapC family toxin [Geminicoccus sp.]HMU49360.1 type II toxin-antitoxin system VapC family toxin [Geminicoccaceae bacterium]